MIEIRDLATRGLQPVRASIGRGEVLGIIGASGSGRTTLLEAIAGARRHMGTVHIDGAPRRPARVALAPEEPEQILFGQTVEQAVIGDRGRQMLEALGGAQLMGRDWLRLSSGERRRVALAAVLGRDRDLLLFDKPTAGLDPEGAEMFWAALAQLGRPAIVVVNDRVEASRCATWLFLPAGGAAVPAREILPYADFSGPVWPPDDRALVGWVLSGRSPASDDELIGEVRRWTDRTVQRR